MDLIGAERMVSRFRQRARDRGPYGELPAGPPEPPAVQTAEFIFRPTVFLARSARVYGSPFTMRVSGVPPIVTHYEEAPIREIFQGSGDVLHAGQANQVLEPIVGTHSLLLLDGARHMSQRRLLLPPFKGERMKAYAGVMAEVTAAEVAGWPEGRAFSLHDATQRITLDIILRTVFGVHDGARMDALRSSLALAVELGSRPALMVRFTQVDLGPRSPWGRFKRTMGAAHELIRRLIDEGRRDGTGERVDVLAMLLEARHEDGEPMSDDEIRDELITLLVAGHETTATALAWCGHRLVLHPEIQDRLIEEVREAFPGGEVDAQKVAELPFLDGFCKETLRVHPVVPGVGRVLQAPMEVDGRLLPAGVMAAISIFLTHNNPELWPEPERFDPTRFIDRKISPYAFLPFGGGIRRCLGMAFALYEMRIALATILSTHRFERGTDAPIEVVRRSVTLAPSRGMPIVARREV